MGKLIAKSNFFQATDGQNEMKITCTDTTFQKIIMMVVTPK